MSKSDAAIEVLVKAKAKLEKGWCQGTWAKDKNGKSCHPRSEYACSWCLGGSFQAIGDPNLLPEVGQAWEAVLGILKKRFQEPGTHGMIGWNDRTAKDQAEVVGIIDEAIASLHGATT